MRTVRINVDDVTYNIIIESTKDQSKLIDYLYNTKHETRIGLPNDNIVSVDEFINKLK